MIDIITKILENTHEYSDGEPVGIGMHHGRVVLDATNEGGHNGTQIDLFEALVAISRQEPGLWGYIKSPEFLKYEKFRQEELAAREEERIRAAEERITNSPPLVIPERPGPRFTVSQEALNQLFKNRRKEK